MMKRTLFCLVALLYMSPNYADVYKWKDANGRTHYGDTTSITENLKGRTDNQADGRTSKGEKIATETENPAGQSALNESKKPANSSVFKMFIVH